MEQTIAVLEKVGLKDIVHYNPNSCELFEQSSSTLSHVFRQNLIKPWSTIDIQDLIRGPKIVSLQP